MTLRLIVTYQIREIIITGALQWREIFRSTLLASGTCYTNCATVQRINYRSQVRHDEEVT